MDQARELLSAGGMRLDALERLHAFHPERLSLGPVVALDREASKAGPVGIVDIQSQDHNVRARDRVDRHTPRNCSHTHSWSPLVAFGDTDSRQRRANTHGTKGTPLSRLRRRLSAGRHGVSTPICPYTVDTSVREPSAAAMPIPITTALPPSRKVVTSSCPRRSK